MPYVAVSRAREQAQIYASREDLGEVGMDTGAIERLAERMRRSGAQEASVTKGVAEQAGERPTQFERGVDPGRDPIAGSGSSNHSALLHVVHTNITREFTVE